MATTQTNQVAPPANYPDDSWADTADWFYVPEQLHQVYASDEARPQSHHVKKLYQQDAIAELSSVHSKGRYVQRPPYEEGHIGGLVPGLRYHEVQVQPGDSSALPYRQWEHEIRLAFAQSAARNQPLADQSYASAVVHACAICVATLLPGSNLGPAWYGRANYGSRCRHAVELAATLRHLRAAAR